MNATDARNDDDRWTDAEIDAAADWYVANCTLEQVRADYRFALRMQCGSMIHIAARAAYRLGYVDGTPD
jgi:hypothetical protein